MTRLAAALLLIAAAVPSFAEPGFTCDAAAARAAVADAAALREKAATLASFSAASRDASLRLCWAAAALRVENGKADGEFLVCAERPAGLSSYAVELRSLDPGAAQAVCDRINECLFERHDQRSPDSDGLAAAWDSLSCPGH